MGFPIAECHADGTFEITKPAGTGGLVDVRTVAEQVVYEVGDPSAYLLPDVTCDWSAIHLEQAGPDRVRVSGAKGRPATATYKVSATHADGFRATGTMMIAGREAVAKAQAVGDAILTRAERLMRTAGHEGFTETSVEVLGGEWNYGAHSRAAAAREVVLKVAVRHPRREALEVFAREIYPAATAMAQGITGFAGGRPEPQPVVRLFSFLVDKADVPVSVAIDGERCCVDIPVPPVSVPVRAVPPAGEAQPVDGPLVHVPMIALAHGRSGDKGDIANIGILARRPEFVPVLRHVLSVAQVAAYLAHVAHGPVEVFDWPGLNGFNILLHEGLGGGGIASLRYDPQGKALAQILLDMPVPVPAAWTHPGGPLAGWGETTVPGDAA